MGDEVFYEGFRQTRVIGLILFCTALICGILSLTGNYGEVYINTLLIYIPYIPILIIVYLLRWLNDPHARDFYCSLNISLSDMIKKYILISQIYVWFVFLTCLPFFIAGAETVTAYAGYGADSSVVRETLFSHTLYVAGTSLLLTGITLIVCALVYSPVAQFFLTFAVMVLPVYIVGIFSIHLDRLFINTGKSYYYDASIHRGSFDIPIIPLAILVILLIWLGPRAIEKLRTGNAINLSRFLNSVACATVSFCLILIAASFILLHLADSIFVSFNRIMSSPETVISLIQHYGTEVRTLADKAPWLQVIALCCLSLIFLILFTVRSTYRQTKKWIDYTIGFSVLVLLCAAFFGVFSVYYSDAVKRFAHDDVDYVRIESVYEDDNPDFGDFQYVNFTDYMKLYNGLEEEDVGLYYNYYPDDYYSFVKTADGNLHMDYGPGNAVAYFNSDARRNLCMTEWHNEIKDILLVAVNRDAETIETVIGAFAPVLLSNNRRYLVVRLYMKDGSSYLRKCFLTAGELKRIDELLSAAE